MTSGATPDGTGNIVMKYLGALSSSKIYKVSNHLKDSSMEKLFLSEVSAIPNDPIERRKVLEDLGYELSDFDLWKGWLFLEESSAEKIITKYLIPWFVPELIKKLRTYSTSGVGNIKTRVESFQKQMVFAHLKPYL